MKKKYLQIKGFTLIELLVVVSIIGMLASITLVALASAKDKANIARGQTFHSGLFHRFGVDAILDMPLNDGVGAGTTVKDVSINGYNGTLMADGVAGLGGFSWDAFPSMNSTTNSLKFNGITAWIKLPIIDSKITNKMTISAWIYPNDVTTSSQGIAGVAWGYKMYMNLTGGKIDCLYLTDSMTDTGHAAFGIIQNNKWQQVACIYDGTSVHVVINGNEVGKVDGLSGNLRNFSGSSNARIGAGWANGASVDSYAFTGYINDVKIYAAAP